MANRDVPSPGASPARALRALFAPLLALLLALPPGAVQAAGADAAAATAARAGPAAAGTQERHGDVVRDPTAITPLPGSQVEDPDGPAPPVPLLWKVSDADSTLWLLGSFHLLKPGDYPLSADIVAAFVASDRLVFELAPADLDGPQAQARLMAAALFPDARRLHNVLPPVTREKLARLLAAQGGSIDPLQAYQPWFVNLSMVLGLAHSMGFQPELGLDRYLMEQARLAGKPVGGLETLDAQLAALAGAPMEEQVRALQDYLANPGQMPGRLEELHDAWRAGDVERLEALTRQEMMSVTPETYRLVNVERNDAWLEQLRAWMRDGSGDMLVVVGALHLLGEDGLVERLGGDGYEVERICSACATPVDAPVDTPVSR